MSEIIEICGAIEKNQLETAVKLIEEADDINGTDAKQWTPLHHGAIGGHLDIVRLLFEKGADPDPKDKGKLTPLFYAILTGNWEMVELLVEKGCDVNATNGNGQNTAHWALTVWTDRDTEESKLEMIQFLVSKGADINARNSMGVSLLEEARMSELPKIAGFLKDLGAESTDVMGTPQEILESKPQWWKKMLGMEDK